MGTARSFAEAAVRLADEVDPGLLEDLAEAVSDDPAREHAMVAAVVRPDDAEFCRAVLRARCSEGRGVLESAAYLRGVAAAYRHRTRTESVEAVWSGPHLHEVPLRSTAAVLVDVVRRARGTLWLTTYSAGAYPPLREALVDGRTRGVRVRVLVETLQGAGSALNGDQPGKAFLGIPGPELWQWPVDRRPDRSTRMHAKIVLADAREMLVSSANLTAAGADRNLEAGILVRGGPPRAAPPSTWTASRQARTSGRCSWAPGERAHDRLGRHGARLAGVGRAAVSNRRRRFGDFPQPVGGSAASPLYRLADVERRLRDHGRTAEISPLDRVWQRMRSGVDDHRLGEVVGDHPGGGLSARRRARRGPRADGAGSGLWHRRSARGAIEGGASEVWGIDVDEAAARISAGRVLAERAHGRVARGLAARRPVARPPVRGGAVRAAVRGPGLGLRGARGGPALGARVAAARGAGVGVAAALPRPRRAAGGRRTGAAVVGRGAARRASDPLDAGPQRCAAHGRHPARRRRPRAGPVALA
ncbi:DISARM system phospholipase D-like protein DrmC [Pseudonocardia sp. RS11V-5]|nr:DISARM system phospholipase D-like protein DrmC [Pseudonocardia terrae]MCE3552992.1 DISARM system phospholipase D-like protein DrmC [Pseudonocardia terrae]